MLGYFNLSLVLNCDDVVLEIYLDHKFQWPQEGLNCESLAYEVVTQDVVLRIFFLEIRAFLFNSFRDPIPP